MIKFKVLIIKSNLLKMQSSNKLLDIFSKRHDMGAPPALHYHFTQLTAAPTGDKSADEELDERVQ